MTLARVAGAAVTWLHPDHLGSAVAGTGPTGAVVWRESEQPFGEDWTSAPANDNQAGYTGHVEDAATGLVYMQARYYNPVTGRFLANDPVGFSPERPDMFNRYAYAANDPVNATDPSGLFGTSLQGGYGIVVGALANGEDPNVIQAGIDGQSSGAASGLLFAVEVALVAADIAAFGPSGEGIAPAAGLRAVREGIEAGIDKGLAGRGVRPSPGSRTIQGQVDDAVSQAGGNPTVQRGGQDLVRMRSSGHGSGGATSTPQNIRNVSPDGTVRMGRGPDRATSNRDMRELYKARDGQGTSQVRTRNGNCVQMSSCN